MKTIHCLIAPSLALGLCPLAYAVDILLISQGSTAPPLQTFLETDEGHTVVRAAMADGPGDVSSYDLIIIARNSNSGAYTQGTEPQDWNGLAKPIILMNSYISRNTHWGWVDASDTGGGTATNQFDAPFPDSAHPIVDGLTDPAEVFATSPTLSPKWPLVTTVNPGGTVVATTNTGARAAITTYNIGTTMANSKGTAGALRIYWPLNDDADWSSMNDNGKQIMRNMIALAITPPGDTDGDGMLDDYELANDLDPNDNGTDFPILGPGGDKDGDGLTNLQEHDGLDANDNPHGFGQTFAKYPDSDDDGVLDNVEITGSSNAFESNVAGSPSTVTPGLATNPNHPDSDGDTLTDGEEISGSLNIAHSNAPTNPNTGDTDGDLMDDRYEIDNNLLGGLNPNLNDADGNLDGDGDFLMSNVYEYLAVKSGVQTRADKLDTDDDGYPDTVEYGLGWTDTSSTGTDPTIADSDGDGLLDGQENPDLAAYPGPEVYPTKSHPLLIDTDGDGLMDGREALVFMTNPSAIDTDSDGTVDTAEVLLYKTNANAGASVPSPAQLAELRVNFQNTTDTTIVAGFQNYTATHENLASFVDQSFSAFGGSNNILVSLSWNPGAVDARPQMTSRSQKNTASGLNPIEWPQLLLD